MDSKDFVDGILMKDYNISVYGESGCQLLQKDRWLPIYIFLIHAVSSLCVYSCGQSSVKKKIFNKIFSKRIKYFSPSIVRLQDSYAKLWLRTGHEPERSRNIPGFLTSTEQHQPGLSIYTVVIEISGLVRLALGGVANFLTLDNSSRMERIVRETRHPRSYIRRPHVRLAARRPVPGTRAMAGGTRGVRLRE